MSVENKTSYLWEYIYMLGLTIIICMLPSLCYRIPYQLILFVAILSAAGVIVVWKRKLSKKLLYFNDLLIILASICLSYFLVTLLIKSKDSLTGIILGVAAVDVFSFTRSGKNTLNARIMGNINSLARLSVCLPVPDKPGLQPIIGVGDLNYYSLIVMFTLLSEGLSAGFISTLTIFAGQILNIITITVIRKKPWYKGFPATLFPGFLIIVAIVLNIL